MAAPTEHDARAYEAFLRGPVGVNTFAFGTVAAYRSGVQHAPQLAVFPEPFDSDADEFGLLGGGGFTVEIADEIEGAGELDWFLLLEDGSYLLLEDDSKIPLED